MNCQLRRSIASPLEARAWAPRTSLYLLFAQVLHAARDSVSWNRASFPTRKRKYKLWKRDGAGARSPCSVRVWGVCTKSEILVIRLLNFPRYKSLISTCRTSVTEVRARCFSHFGTLFPALLLQTRGDGESSTLWGGTSRISRAVTFFAFPTATRDICSKRNFYQTDNYVFQFDNEAEVGVFKSGNFLTALKGCCRV